MIAADWNWQAWRHAWGETESGVWVLVGMVAVPYLAGLTRLWSRAGVGRGVSIAQSLCYLGGVAVLFIALASPLDTIADGLFSAHMVQHLLLIAVVPPLLIGGAPLVAGSWLTRGIPVGELREHRWLRPVRASWRLARIAWIAWLLHTATVWGWHLPKLYQLTLVNGFWHGVEHLSFLGTALLLWWVAMQPNGVRRNGYGVGVLLMLGTAMQGGALGALLASARTVWYPLQTQHAAAWGLTPLADQQLAGLIMWIPGGLIYVGAACALFLAWVARPELPLGFGAPASGVR